MKKLFCLFLVLILVSCESQPKVFTVGDCEFASSDTAMYAKGFLDTEAQVCIFAAHHDINNNGIPELILESYGKGCGSCHFRKIFVIEKGNIIFQQEGNEISVNEKTFAQPGKIFITEHVYYENDALCCPSEKQIIEYKCEEFKEKPFTKTKCNTVNKEIIKLKKKVSSSYKIPA